MSALTAGEVDVACGTIGEDLGKHGVPQTLLPVLFSLGRIFLRTRQPWLCVVVASWVPWRVTEPGEGLSSPNLDCLALSAMFSEPGASEVCTSY